MKHAKDISKTNVSRTQIAFDSTQITNAYAHQAKHGIKQTAVIKIKIKFKHNIHHYLNFFFL